VAREAAVSVAPRPGDLDLMLRKFLYASESPGAAEPGDPMAEPLSDFSKILELQEIKKLYDELQDRHHQDLHDRDEEIRRLRDEVGRLSPESAHDESEGLRAEVERLGKQMQLLRQEYEAKIERLNARLREQPQAVPAAAATESGKGFFRR
jgi:hypothetical protein